MHEAAALLTGQPIFKLSTQERDALTGSLCDVLDYHEINLTEAGGAGGLYVALALTAFAVYKPRLDAIAAMNGKRVVNRPVVPPTPQETVMQAASKIDYGVEDTSPAATPDTSSQSDGVYRYQ